MDGKSVFFFAVGALIGIGGTYIVLRRKCEENIKQEIDAYKKDAEKKLTEDKEDFDTDTGEYREEIKKYQGISEENKPEETLSEKPYIISPDEFGERDGYGLITLVFYSDGYLADDLDDEVTDSSDIVGDEWKNHFGEYEGDSVFVRNDRLKCDYEILRDERKYSEVLETKPHWLEDV